MTVLLAALQLNSSPDLQANFSAVYALCQQLKEAEHRLVVLPECWAIFGGIEAAQLEQAETLGQGPIQTFLANLAQEFGLWLVSGTIPIKADPIKAGSIKASNNKFYAACLVFNPQGRCVAQYNKIHLFDVEVADNTQHYLESKYTQAGQDIVVLETPFAKIGLAVCYDVRFPELFRVMQNQGADIICLPSAFTFLTGEAHWQPLIQARAIENQCFMVAAGQTGTHRNGRKTWGHSLIVDGWGKRLAQATEEPCIVQTLVDLTSLTAIRAKMPNKQHRKIKVSSNI
ncbi:carbon-nitrogen hydrolase family protein [Algibacillus agarilyticus]|uniref:carbon-nitrogen hydrolase family protein n=1 Tax=Algibacillus agarilyticus TaxID=2234133 RepID=UPI000DD0DCB8|nr:carbon-nitrogen hydrolase family protein [Algibacillus agarilyticus]